MARVSITRRQVVAVLAATSAAAAGSAGGLALRWWDRAPGEGLAALSQDEHDFLQAVAEAWMPAGGTPPLSGADAQAGRFLDAVVASMSPATGRELKLLLQALDDWPIPRRLAPFRRLPLDTRIAVLHGWRHSDRWLLRNAALGVLVLVAEAVTMHPRFLALLAPNAPCGFGP
jgi:hypothetical protein